MIADVAQIVKHNLKIVDAGGKVILGMDVLVVDVVAYRFIDLVPLTVAHLILVSEDRNENLEAFMKKIDIAEPHMED